MSALFVLVMAALVGVCVVSLVAGALWHEAKQWRASLVAFELRLPRGLTANSVSAWLDMLSSTTRRLPVVLELVGSDRGIRFFLLTPETLRQAVLGQLRSALPGVRVTEADGAYLQARPRLRAVRELRLSRLRRPLAPERAETAVAALLSALSGPYARGERLHVQWILAGSRARPRQPDALPEEQRAEMAKQRASLLRATARIAVSAPTTARAYQVLNRAVNALRVVETPGVSIQARALPFSVVIRRFHERAWPLGGPWPLLLNSAEAVMVGLPVGELHIPGLSLGTARQLPAPHGMPTAGAVVGLSNFPGMEQRPLALRMADRLMHTYIVGPTGTGKSTLFAKMLLQDIQAGYGAVVVDPKGDDLVPSILARIPDSRRDDVIILDPAATDRPIGWNVLGVAQDEHGRELAVDFVVHAMAELWRGSWGPRTADVLRASLLTLVTTRAADGSAFTLVDLPALLTNDRFRQFVLRQPTVPLTVRDFWAEYEARSDSDRAAVIGPSLNKIRQFSTRTALRLMLGQSTGIDLHEVFRSRKILLIPLGKGTVGAETAQLLGALVVSGLWSAALTRVTIPEHQRHPVVCYIDEAQDVVRLPLALEDVLAQARSLKLALVLANQSLGQFPASMQSAVLEVARTTISFQSGHKNATALAPYFGPLTVEDLKGLETHEIAMRPCVGGQTLTPVTGMTLPLGEPMHEAAQLARWSRERLGTLRADVEAAMAARLAVPSKGELGRRSYRGGPS